MNSNLLALVTCVFVTISAAYSKPIPDHWKNNPQFKIVYEVVRPFSSFRFSDKVSFKVGDKVILSQRSFSNLTRRDNKQKLGLLRLGGENQDDGGLYDGYLPALSYIKATTEAAPLTHWQVAYRKRYLGTVPNIKPNYYYHTTFPLNVYPAKKITGDRPRLIYYGQIFRLLSPSPVCKNDELRIRLKLSSEEQADFYTKIWRTHSNFVFAGYWYGTDYCMRLVDFLDSGAQQYKLVDPKLKDQLKWEEVSKLYYKNLLGSEAFSSKAIQVSPFSALDKVSGRSGPSIRIVPSKSLPLIERKKLPKGTHWIAEYAGPLYYACAGGVCRVQGYKIALDEEGKLVGFIANRLYYWDGKDELLLKTNDEKRLLAISNDADLLDKVYVWAKGDQKDSYSASMSRLSKMEPSRRAGNSFGTFVIHISKIRERLGYTKHWPIYDGSAPGAVKDFGFGR